MLGKFRISVARVAKITGSWFKDTDIDKDVFFVLSRAWDKEKILSPREESNLRPSDSALRCSNAGIVYSYIRGYRIK